MLCQIKDKSVPILDLQYYILPGNKLGLIQKSHMLINE